MLNPLACDVRENGAQQSCRRRTEPCWYRVSERLAEIEQSIGLGSEDSLYASSTQVGSECDSDGEDCIDEDGGQFCSILTDEDLLYTPLYHADFIPAALDETLSMVPPCPVGALSAGLPSSLQYMVTFTFPMVMQEATSVVTQPTQRPANMGASMPTLLGSLCRKDSTVSKVKTPYTTAPDHCTPAPNGEVEAATPDLAAAEVETRTSLLLRNLPDGFMRSEVMDMFRAQGLATNVDFLYTPGSIKLKQSCGYAFVNFTTADAARECLEKMHGYSWGAPGGKVCEVTWCEDHQGLDSHVERHRNSTIMHDSVDDEYKPALFSNGFRIPFPIPSKKLRKPRLRKFSCF
jgi:hypothetical protein